MKIEDKTFEEKVNLSKLQCCGNCINLVNKQLDNSFKKVKFCEVYKTEIKEEWLYIEQTPLCEKLDYVPF